MADAALGIPAAPRIPGACGRQRAGRAAGRKAIGAWPSRAIF